MTLTTIVETQTCKCGVVLHLFFDIRRTGQEGGVEVSELLDLYAASATEACRHTIGTRTMHDVGVVGRDMAVRWHLGNCKAVMPVCARCGCTEVRPCDEGLVDEEPCHWIEPGLCSACVGCAEEEVAQ